MIGIFSFLDKYSEIVEIKQWIKINKEHPRSWDNKNVVVMCSHGTYREVISTKTGVAHVCYI